MKAITAEEWELVSAFEVNPTYLDAADPWPYTDALFRVEQGSTVLSFAVSPAYRDVRIVLQQAGATLYELNATAVLDVCYRREGTRESVEVILGETECVVVTVKPAIHVDHQFSRPERD